MRLTTARPMTPAPMTMQSTRSMGREHYFSRSVKRMNVFVRGLSNMSSIFNRGRVAVNGGQVVRKSGCEGKFQW